MGPREGPGRRLGPRPLHCQGRYPTSESQTERGRRFCRRAAKFFRLIRTRGFGRVRGPGSKVANAWAVQEVGFLVTSIGRWVGRGAEKNRGLGWARLHARQTCGARWRERARFCIDLHGVIPKVSG